jgi:hypothetical protein
MLDVMTKDPFDPAMVVKVLEILRVAYNFTIVGEDRKTPAMRLGLVNERYDEEDILNHPEIAPPMKRAKPPGRMRPRSASELLAPLAAAPAPASSRPAANPEASRTPLPDPLDDVPF